jgi:hypothetical protein
VATRVLEEKPIGFGNNPDKPYRFIRRQCLEQAVTACEVLETHARRAYFCITSPALEGARVLAEKILAKELKNKFRYADIYRKGWTGLGSPEAAKRAVDVLLECGWVILESFGALDPNANKGRRPGPRFVINPRTYEK